MLLSSMEYMRLLVILLSPILLLGPAAATDQAQYKSVLVSSVQMQAVEAQPTATEAQCRLWRKTDPARYRKYCT